MAALSIAPFASSTAAYNITTGAPDDWALWVAGSGLGTTLAPSQRKSGGGSTISNISRATAGNVAGFTGYPAQVSWSGGTPTASGGPTDAAVYNNLNDSAGTATGQGLSLTLPADTTTRTARVYCGTFNGRPVTLTATLSDGSAGPASNASLSDPTGSTGVFGYFDITYSAASAGQTITLGFVVTTAGGGFADIEIQAVSVKAATGAAVAPSGIATSSAVGTPNIGATAAPAGVAASSALGAPSVGAGLAPAGIATSSAIGTPTAGLIQAVAPSGIATASALGAPGVGVTLAPAGVATAAAYGSPAVGAAGGIVAVGIASAAAYGAPALGVTLAPAGVASVAVVGLPSAGATLAAAGIASSATFGTPAVSLVSGVAPTGIASAAAYGVPGLGLGLAPAGVASLAAFGTPAVMATQALGPVGIGSAAAFGVPLVYDPNDTGPTQWVHYAVPGESRAWRMIGEGRLYRIPGESRIWRITP